VTDPYDPSLPRSSSDLGGPPGTGPRVPPADLGAATPGHAGMPDAEPVAAPAPAAPTPAAQGQVAGGGVPAPGFNEKGHVRATKVSGLWILLIIFIAQNSRPITLHFFGWRGRFSLALTILLSAVLGILLVAIPGSLRIMQLRRALRKNVPSGRTLG
jgi:uncharacterized integral membrane protein